MSSSRDAVCSQPPSHLTLSRPYLQRDFIFLLPEELALEILSYLGAADLCTCAFVSRTWRYVAEKDTYVPVCQYSPLTKPCLAYGGFSAAAQTSIRNSFLQSGPIMVLSSHGKKSVSLLATGRLTLCYTGVSAEGKYRASLAISSEAQAC